MDKNKSAFKLKGFGPLYVINLDGQAERWEWMEKQLEYWELDSTRISAYDGREDDLSDIIKGRYPEMMTSGEVGCVTSHLKVLSASGMKILIVLTQSSWKTIVILILFATGTLIGSQ